MTSQERVVRNPPQYGVSMDTQEELDWYGSNPEGIDRDRTPQPFYSDDDGLPIAQEVEDSDPSDGERSQPTYSDASRSSSPSPPLKSIPTSHHPAVKRKASTPLDSENKPRIGTKRRKVVPPISPEVASTILQLPEDTPDTREACFLLRTPIIWTAEQFDAYWPLVNNFWVCNKPNNAVTGKGTQSSYWWCRLHKGETVSETHGQRNKSLRRVAPCGMKLKMVKAYSQLDHSILLSVEISLHLDKKHPCWEHNHGRDYVDQCKINSFVMNAAGLAVAQGWEVHSVYSNLKGVKWTHNLTALEAAGGRHLKLIDCHNAGTEWKKAHPDQRIQGAKMPWPQQWAGCLKDLEQLEAVRCVNITAKRDIAVQALEISGRKELIRDGGRPVCSIQELSHILAAPMVRYGAVLSWLSDDLDSETGAAEIKTIFSRQFMRWWDFRRSQWHNRGLGDSEVGLSAFLKASKRKYEGMGAKTMVSAASFDETIRRQWQKMPASRRPPEAQTFSAYSDAVKIRLAPHHFTQQLQLREDPQKQGAWTDWLEYLSFELRCLEIKTLTAESLEAKYHQSMRRLHKAKQPNGDNASSSSTASDSKQTQQHCPGGRGVNMAKELAAARADRDASQKPINDFFRETETYTQARRAAFYQRHRVEWVIKEARLMETEMSLQSNSAKSKKRKQNDEEPSEPQPRNKRRYGGSNANSVATPGTPRLCRSTRQMMCQTSVKV